MTPDSAVQSATAIERQALRSEDNGPVACIGLQAPVLSGRLVKLAAPSHTAQTVLKLFASVSSLLQARLSISIRLTILYWRNPACFDDSFEFVLRVRVRSEFSITFFTDTITRVPSRLQHLFNSACHPVPAIRNLAGC